MTSRGSLGSDAGAEIRAILDSVDSRLGLLEAAVDTNDPTAAIIADLRRDRERILDLITEDASVAAPVDRAIALAIEAVTPLAAERSVAIIVEAARDLATRMSREGLVRCLEALVTNAIDFSPSGSDVLVSAREAGSMIRIAVRDQGGGIVGINPGHIFERSESDGHSGGLAIVRELVERFGGTVGIAATSREGTEIELMIPAVPLG